jgi:thiol:disulfide interchange protein DsbA
MKIVFSFLGLLFLLTGFVSAAETTAVDPALYTTVSGERINEDARIEVTEFFWYTCPHCDGFDPYLEKWLTHLPKDVAFYHMPAVYDNDPRLPLAKAFFVAEILGVLPKVHHPLFDAIRQQKQHLNTEAIAALFKQQAGVSEEEFMQQYNSFAIDSALRKAQALTKAYGIQSVPSLVVNGQYRLNSSQINGYDNMLKTVDQLIDQVRQAKTLAK